MKDYNEGKLYGGIALIVVGIIILVENVDSYPLFIVLTIIGVILILCSTKDNGNTKTDSFSLLINNCKILIEKYETPLRLGETSCSSLLIEEITKLKNASKTEVKLDTDKIDQHAHFLLLNRCFTLLSSGEYHIYRGKLDPNGVAPTMQKVYEGCAKWLLDNGSLSQEEYDEHRSQLRENVSLVG